MNDINLTPEQLQALLQFASKKVGMSPEQLAKTVQTGGLDALVSRVSPSDMNKLKAYVGDKSQMEQLLQSPQMQQAIRDILNK